MLFCDLQFPAFFLLTGGKSEDHPNEKYDFQDVHHRKSYWEVLQ